MSIPSKLPPENVSGYFDVYNAAKEKSQSTLFGRISFFFHTLTTAGKHTAVATQIKEECNSKTFKAENETTRAAFHQYEEIVRRILDAGQEGLDASQALRDRQTEVAVQDAAAACRGQLWTGDKLLDYLYGKDLTVCSVIECMQQQADQPLLPAMQIFQFWYAYKCVLAGSRSNSIRRQEKIEEAAFEAGFKDIQQTCETHRLPPDGSWDGFLKAYKADHPETEGWQWPFKLPPLF